MVRNTRRSLIILLVGIVASLALPGRTARADELPQHACAIEFPFHSFAEIIKDEADEIMEETQLGQYDIEITNISITAHLGQLGYQTTTWVANYNDPMTPVDDDIRSVTRPHGYTGLVNDPNTSNDDYIEVVATVVVTVGLISASIDLHIALAIPESWPPVGDPSGRTCTCRKWTHDERHVMFAAPPCEPPSEQNPQDCHQPIFWGTPPAVLDYNFIDYPIDTESSGRYEFMLDYNAPPFDFYPGGGDPRFDFACDRVDVVPCSQLTSDEASPYFGSSGMTVDEGDYACVLCIHEVFNEFPVTITDDDFPGFLAVDLWATGVPWLFDWEVQDGLRKEGYTDSWEDGPAEDRVFYDRACCLQKDLSGAMADIRELFGSFDVPGVGPDIDIMEVIRGAGVRISDTKHAVYMMIPPLNVYPGIDDDLRPDGEPECASTHVYSDLTGIANDIAHSRFIDFPKVLHHMLTYSPDAVDRDLKVRCNHDVDCSIGPWNDTNGDGLCNCQERGLIDYDADGFCNDVDYCPFTFTGANCDIDGDGYGDGPRRIVEKCIIIDPMVGTPYPYYGDDIEDGFDSISRSGRGQGQEAARQFFCGGCDNCPSVHNPHEHHLTEKPYFSLWWPWYLPVLQYELPRVPSWQEDIDADGIGDACDEDADDDGIHASHNCDDLNYGIGLDLDGDNVCDPPSHTACDNACAGASSYYWGGFDLQRCYDRCDFPDNCIDDQSAFCNQVGGCSSTAAAETPAACAAAGSCVFIPGPDWTYSSYGNRCIPAETWCSDVYANIEQGDTDGDVSGDKCDWFNVGDPEFKRLGGGGTFVVIEDQITMNIAAGKDYEVSFHARGGQPTLVGNHIQWNPETRTNTQIGACYCDYHLPDGTWNPLHCDNQCPKLSDARPNEFITAWKPINAPECSDRPYTGPPAWENVYNTYGVCHNRELLFSRNEAVNYWEFIWPWMETRDFLNFSQTIGPEYAETMPATGASRSGWAGQTVISLQHPGLRPTRRWPSA